MSTKEGISKVFASKIFHTVRKFYNFSITEILREINMKFLRCKIDIFTHLEALNFDFYAFLQLLTAEIYQINQIQSTINGKNGSFMTLRFSKIDFT